MTTETTQTTEIKAESSLIDLESAVSDAVDAVAAVDLDHDVEKEGGLESALEAAKEWLAALESLESARAALDTHIDAGGSATWLADDGNAEVEYEDCTAADAAQQYVDGGDWGDSSSPDYVGEIDVYCQAKFLPDRERECHGVELQQDDPECSDEDGHDWQSPHSIVGGIKENPGVWGHGGGVIINEVCMHCGCKKTTDTWATNSTNGTNFTSVTYEEGYYSEEIEKLDSDE